MSRSILIADDHPPMREFYQTMLGAFAFDMASDGEELLRLALAQPYRLILTDLTMPGLTGFEAVRLIRSQTGPNQNTCICSISGDPSPETSQTSGAKGFDQHYGKPVDLAVLTRLFQWASEPDLPRFVLPVD